MYVDPMAFSGTSLGGEKVAMSVDGGGMAYGKVASVWGQGVCTQIELALAL